MKLVLDISATDKTAAAVVSTTNTTAVPALEQLVLGDNVALDLTFTDSSVTPHAAPAWAGVSGYTPIVGLGVMDANGLLAYTSTTGFTAQTAGWLGRLALNTDAIVQGMQMAVNTTGGLLANLATDPRSRNQRPQYCYLWLQVQVVDPSGQATTYAQLRVIVVNRVLPASAITTSTPTDAFYAWFYANAVRNLSTITSLTGGGSSTLDGQLAGTGTFPVGCLVVTSNGNIARTWRLIGTYISATDLPNGKVKPLTSDAVTNPCYWQLV